MDDDVFADIFFIFLNAIFANLTILKAIIILNFILYFKNLYILKYVKNKNLWPNEATPPTQLQHHPPFSIFLANLYDFLFSVIFFCPSIAFYFTLFLFPKLFFSLLHVL